jgi:hypothetical protein
MYCIMSSASKLFCINHSTNTMETSYSYVFVIMLHLDYMYVIVIDMNDVNYNVSLTKCDERTNK